ncbi:MAG: glycosyltransferase [Flavobacteriaceae bacterium]|nr:glycosyltransferase [Flavobacteriaceae bacterium]
MQSTNKKVCIVTISLAKGGAERSCAMLSEMLSEKGHEVHIVTLNDQIDYPFSGTLFNLGKLKTGKDSFFKRWKRLTLLQNYIKEHSFDFIIDHRPKNQYRREMLYHRKVYKNQKVIYVAHSSNKEEYLTNKPRRFAQISNRNFSNVAVSDYIKEEVLRKAGIENAITIHNAFNPKWAADISEVPEILKGKKYVLTYGRMVDEIKDFRFLIESYEASNLHLQNVHLVIMGDGPDKEKIRQFVSGLGSKEYIHFLPFVSSPFSIIKKAEFVTLTSKYEGFPMVLVESLSVGTPVVSLDIISGPNEIVKHEVNGLLVSERNIPLFAAALERLVTDKELYASCKASARESVERFSKDEIANKWNSLLHNEE